MNYSLTRLSSGVRVITVPMKDRSSASVAVWVKAGARFETQKISGVSHFLEHMLFKGTKNRNTREIKEEIEGVGGILNAFTGEESTCYFAKLLVPHFPRALDVLVDMVKEATLSQEEMTKERTVILEEIKMYKDLPSHHVHDLMGELMWPHQALGRSVSGTEESVSKLSRSEMVRYKKQFYHPRNIIVSVAGSVEPQDVEAMVERRFRDRDENSESEFETVKENQKKPALVFLEKTTEQTHWVIGLRGLSRFSEDRYALGLLNVILGCNMSSRLFEEVREKRGLAYEIRSGASFYNDTGMLSITAGVEKTKAPMAIKVVLRELEKFRKKLVTEDELRRAKDYFMSQLYMAIEDTLEHLLWVGERVLDGGEVPDHNKIKRNIEAVTREDIQRVAQNLFINQALNLALIGPIPEKIQNQIRRSFELQEF